jgi:hypothetical protein
MFDSTFTHIRIAGFVFCIVTYLTITIPSLRTVVTPLPADTHTDQVQALQLVSAANVINIVIISLIFGLQVSSSLSLCIFLLLMLVI